MNRIPPRRDTLEIAHVKKGSVCLEYDNGTSESLREKSVLIDSFITGARLRYNENHCHDTFAVRCPMKVVTISAQDAAESVNNNLPGFILPHSITDPFLSAYIANSIEKVIELYHSGTAASGLLCTSALFSVLAKASEYALHMLPSGMYASAGEKKYADKMISYINSNFVSRITIDEICEYAGLSRSYASRLFKKITDRSMVDYINLKRVEYIKELIKYKNSGTSQICGILYFCDEKYVCRMFKKYTGLSMKEYKKVSENTDYNEFTPFNDLR